MPLKKGLRMELDNFVKAPSYRAFNAGRDKKIDALVANNNAKPGFVKSKLLALKRKVGDFLRRHGLR